MEGNVLRGEGSQEDERGGRGVREKEGKRASGIMS